MIKVIENECEIKGSKDDVITELQIITRITLESLGSLDKLILLYSLTDIINESIKEKINEDE